MSDIGLIVTLDDVDVTCHAFEPISISWGREHPADGFEPRRAAVTMDAASGVRRGQRMRVGLNAPATDPEWRDGVGAWSAQTGSWFSVRVRIIVFDGNVTDTDTRWAPRIPHEEWRTSIDVLAVDPVGPLGSLIVGSTPFPQESVTARATRIAALTPLTWVVDPSAAIVAARDVDAQPALNLLDELTHMASLGGGIWFDPNTTTATFMLDAGRNSSVPGVLLDGCRITDEAHLQELVGDVINDASVTYVDAVDVSVQHEARAVNQASIDAEGRRHLTISTTLINAADAQARANTQVERFGRALPRWADVKLLSQLETARDVAETIMRAGPRLRVRLSDEIPPPAVIPWDGYVEGWQLEARADDWQIILQLSPAAWSGPLLSWSGVPAGAGHTWADAAPGYRWMDATDRVRWITDPMEDAA